MDLHQGSNEYTPLRSKPITAAMKQEQKHIESSVYDPRTGKTVVSAKNPSVCAPAFAPPLRARHHPLCVK